VEIPSRGKVVKKRILIEFLEQENIIGGAVTGIVFQK